MTDSKKRLIIVDVSNFIFRAFYAIRVLHSPDGTPVNAVHGILSMFLKLISDYRPTHLLLAKDTSGGSFRNDLYENYKANRSEPPEELVPQFGLISQLIEKMGLVSVANQTYEADDIIGTACTQWAKDFDEILIASGDKDLMQFVNEKVKIIDTMKDKIFDRKAVYEKMGVYPEQIVDYLTMVGDTSDNIPGMKGIGAKGAAKLLEEYGTFENCVDKKDSFKGKKLINAFENHLEDARLSKKLVEIVTDVDLGIRSSDTVLDFYPSEELISFLKNLGFKGGVTRLEQMKYDHARAEENDKNFVADQPSEIQFEVVRNSNDLEKVLGKILGQKMIGFHTEYNSDHLFSRELISLGIEIENSIFVIPFKRIGLNTQNFLKSIFEKKDLTLITEHSKRDVTFGMNQKIQIDASLFDIVQAHYILGPSRKHDLEFMAEEVGIKLHSPEKSIRFVDQMDEQSEMNFVAERAMALGILGRNFYQQLKVDHLENVYNQIDGPLLPILAKMEYVGVAINPGHFKKMETDLDERINFLVRKIQSFSENNVNLNSPKQVGEFLFEELALPVVKKTKTGFSTDSEVLEELADLNVSEVPALLLQYRELVKINSTYVKAIPALADPFDGRIHTNFNLHVAATGRLSSLNPNLQNIPIRSKEGRLVRKGFIASPGNLLLAADYSQVELRLLAHFSEDPTMLKSFHDGVDIHLQTASEVGGIPIDKVGPEERSKAKAVNFGLMYGQSSFGLAKSLKISRKEAKDYIDRYFTRFGRVKSFLDSLKEQAEKTGYAITMHGRKRYLPDIKSTNRTIKSNAERVAINSPIQGTAADIIKLAMININQRLISEGLKSQMILQVHDELIFDVQESELSAMEILVREEMEGVVDLKVPFSVQMGHGVNWFDLK